MKRKLLAFFYLTFALVIPGTEASNKTTEAGVFKAESVWLAFDPRGQMKIPIYSLVEKTEKNYTSNEMVTIMVAGPVVAVLNITMNDTSVVTGETSEESMGLVIHTMNIKFDEPITGDNVTFEHLELSLELVTNLNVSKWQFVAMNVSYSATMNGINGVNGINGINGINGSNGSAEQEKDVTQTDPILVTPKVGYTKSTGDAVCTNGYRICSPTTLFWSCNTQILKPLVPPYTDLKYMAGIVIEGMRLQPFVQNQTQRFAYYNWDCDPLISIPLWETLLVTLFLAYIVIWALSYITSVPGPDRFDDPNKPTIAVPTTE